MAKTPPSLGPNLGSRFSKAERLRLSDVATATTTDYADVIVGDGPPAGGYGAAAGASLMYLDKAADSAGWVPWVSSDGGTTWALVGSRGGARFTLEWVGGQRGKPGLNADIQNAAEATREIADPDFEILGTNATSGSSSFNTSGGIKLTTAGADNDQAILVPHLDVAQSAWNVVLWPTSKSLIWEADILTDASVTAMIFWLGLKLTNTPVIATDNDQVFVRYQDTQNSAKFQVVSSIGGVDTTTNTTGSAVATATAYRVRIAINSSRVAKVYIDGTLVLTTTALTSVDLIPYIGVQASGAAAAKSITIRRQMISRLY